MTILLLGGGSAGILDYIADSKNNVKQVMPKGDEQKEALATLKTVKKRTQAHNKQIKKTFKGLTKEFEVHDASGDDINRMWSEFYSERKLYDSDMLDLRFELKEHISRDEWEKIFPSI
jgi:hypothetical protein